MNTIAFLGSKKIGWLCFEYLLRQEEALGINIIAVMTNQKRNDEWTLKFLESGKPVLTHLTELPECDYIISVQYHEILKDKDIEKAHKLAANLHMAPLPEYRGCNQFSYAIIENKKEFGTTIHVMDAQIDHGDIIAEKRFPIPEDIWVSDLVELTEAHSYQLFTTQIQNILNGKYQRKPQSSLINQKGSSIHYRKEIDQLKFINLEWTPEKINRHIRATYMPGFPPPYTMIDDIKVEFVKSEPA